MPVVNPLARELVFKIVYYGPGLGGKTTTLQHIHSATRPEHRGKMVSLATPVDRTLYFDFLPLRVPNLRGLGVRLQLFTVPGQVYYNATRKLVLTGADGVVFVADSQRARLDANLESIENLRDNLLEHGRSLEELPFALAYNKRDLDDLVSIADLEQRMNPGQRAPSFPTCATRGEGVFETLDAVARMVLDDFEQRMPESRTALSVEGFGLAEGGLIDALRLADGAPATDERTNGVAHEGGDKDGASRVRHHSVPSMSARLEGELASHVMTDESWRPTASEPAARESVLPRDSLWPQDGVWPESEVPLPPASFKPPPHLAPPRAPSFRPLAPSVPPLPGQESRPGAHAGLSFLAVWPEEDRALAREVEGNLARGDAQAALLGAGSLVKRSLTRQAANDENEGLVLIVLALGIDGERYLWLRRSIAQVRAGATVPREDALLAYVFALDVARRCR